jgi:hypothetical protein
VPEPSPLAGAPADGSLQSHIMALRAEVAALRDLVDRPAPPPPAAAPDVAAVAAVNDLRAELARTQEALDSGLRLLAERLDHLTTAIVGD